MTDRGEHQATHSGAPWSAFTYPVYPLPVRDTGQMVRALQDIKGAQNPELVSWGSMTGIEYEHHVPFSNCTWDNTPGVSEMYVTPMLVLKAAMGAAVEESCPVTAAEFPEIVERMAESASGLKTHFQLSAPVDASRPVSITVNGVAVPASDSQGSVWTLQPSRNEVRFRLDRTPDPGQLVRISYFTAP